MPMPKSGANTRELKEPQRRKFTASPQRTPDVTQNLAGGISRGDRPVSCVLRERENPATLPFEGPQLGYSITRSKATSWLAAG